MRRARAALAAGLVLVPALLVTAGPARPTRTLVTRKAELEKAEEALLRLVELARQDSRMALVERYLSWTRAEDFANPRREVRPARLLEFVADDDAPMELRRRARDALVSVTHRSLDPDLLLDEGKGKRATFSRERLVPLLLRPGEKAEATRTFAAEILDSYWHFADADIQRFNPRDETTWRKAADAYRSLLRGR
jgi:hypothetical protein